MHTLAHVYKDTSFPIMFRIVRYVFNLLYAQPQVGLIAQQSEGEIW